MLVVIDGDAIAYRSACAVQKKRWVLIHNRVRSIFPSGTRKSEIIVPEGADLIREEEVEHVSHALQIAKGLMNKIKVWAEGTDGDPIYSVYLSSQDSSDPRYKIAVSKPYKGNRPKEKPVHLAAVREYLQTYHDATIVVGEADDEIAQQATIADKFGMPCVMVHIDKDIDQVPGYHYNFVTETEYYIDEFSGYYNFCMQMLTGDTSDNVPGLKGIGPAKARGILMRAKLRSIDGREDYLEAVRKAYKDAGKDEAYFQEMHDLLWLRRGDEEERINKEGSGA